MHNYQLKENTLRVEIVSPAQGLSAGDPESVGLGEAA